MRRLCCLCWMLSLTSVCGDEKLTSLDNQDVKFKVAEKHYVKLQRGPVTAVIVDNAAVNDEVLKNHRAGYSGVASLTHVRQPRNIFVPNYAGLNFEHIHDGTQQDRKALFEPRHFPMQLRVIDQHTVELYQAPTPTWGLESCHRYQLLPDGTLQLTFECIPRRRTFRNGYIGLFWASYINQPQSLDIHLRGRPEANREAAPRWIRGITPRHGVESTHVGSNDRRRFKHDEQFPLTLVFNRSKYRYTEPWYYGVSHKMAAVYLFRPQDQVRLTQSPSGGGRGNPAWDFQTLLGDYQVGQRYQLVMRLMYTPFQSAAQVARESRTHRHTLGMK